MEAAQKELEQANIAAA
jgi:two-component system, sensor histidine kinase and response regulator